MEHTVFNLCAAHCRPDDLYGTTMIKYMLQARKGLVVLTNQPLISIIIPTHNRAALLPKAVSSALSWPGTDVEILVVEDGSNVAKQALADFISDPRLILTKNQDVRGASSARNFGAKIARGQILLFLDDDDEFIGDYVSRVKDIAMSEEAFWGFARQKIRADAGHELLHDKKSKIGENSRLADRRVPFRRKVAPLGAGFWIRRSLYWELGGLSVDLVIDEDTDLCCRLLAAGFEPWLEARFAVVIDRSPEIERLTNQDNKSIIAECYLRTFTRNFDPCRHVFGAPAYLAFRAQRMILRSGRVELLSKITERLQSPWLRLALALKYHIFRLRHS